MFKLGKFETRHLVSYAKTLSYAVWQHGHAADGLQAARSNWVVEDLADEIGNVR